MHSLYLFLGSWYVISRCSYICKNNRKSITPRVKIIYIYIEEIPHFMSSCVQSYCTVLREVFLDHNFISIKCVLFYQSKNSLPLKLNVVNLLYNSGYKIRHKILGS